MDQKERALQAHRDWKGKIEVISRCKVENADDLSIAYTPGVAQPCLEIQKDVNKSYELFTQLGKINDTSTLFSKFIDSENELMEYKKNFDVIKNFFENQRPIFEKGCNRIDIY